MPDCPLATCVPILFVDDDASMRRTFARAIAPYGYDVELASSGQEALRMAQDRVYAVVVTDLRMPGIDGMALIELLGMMRPGTAFVILTGLPELDLPKAQAGEQSIVSVLGKPWDETEMLETLERAIELHQHWRRDAAETAVGTSVLLLEDNPGDADLVNIYLSEVGAYEITHVDRLDAALNQLREHSFDVVLSDLSLPDARGLDCVRRIQQMSPKSALIVLSGLEDDQVAMQAMQLGAQDYLPKRQINEQSLHRAIRYASERKRVERRLSQLAHFDQLTGLANRTTFRNRLDHVLARARRKQLEFAVMFLDLDRFKTVNDSLGHDAGDALLQQVSERLQRCVRDYDTVARLGGDEFAILLEDLSGGEIPTVVAERITAAFGEPFFVAEAPLPVATSIGIAEFPGDASTADELMKCADMAMYSSKGRERTTYSTFPPVKADWVAAADLQREVRQGLERQRYVLHYQPQIELGGNRVQGAEALLRLKRSDGTLIPPVEFIPILEDTGQILEVGEWVLREACQQAARWHEAGHVQTVVAVNLSARQFERPGLVATVENVLNETQLDHQCLELEITEGLLMRDTGATNTSLSALKELGVRLAIDDFGTGYSSLAYLDRFEVDVLKIDRAFVKNITDGRNRGTIASAIVGLGHKVGLQVVAEGVETPSQLNFLRQEGCDSVQGYLLGRPAEHWEPNQPIGG